MKETGAGMEVRKGGRKGERENITSFGDNSLSCISILVLFYICFFFSHCVHVALFNQFSISTYSHPWVSLSDWFPVIPKSVDVQVLYIK